MSNILITGSRNGLGQALAIALTAAGHNVIEYDITAGQDVRRPNLEGIDHLDVLINNAGVNIIDWLYEFTEENWDKVMDTNTKGIFMMTQACLPLLIQSKGTVLNIVSNAAHMPMRCSLAYNASKGAALIMTKQLARELTPKYGITVFSVSPNKLAGTGMSKSIDEQVVATRGWTAEQAQAYQLQGMLTGEETQPAALAEFIAFLLQDKAHHKALSGCDMPYGI
jgi:NAD(P)-dependent dehydrogenase (short-subunit alcohol dehydrogenase family)